MKIHLVTGATGFVGKYLVSALLERGEKVWIIVRPLNNVSSQARAKDTFQDYLSKWPNEFKVVDGDIMVENLNITDSVIEELKNHEVIFWHLAANLSFASENRADVQRTNYIGTINVVNFANKAAKKFMHMSTAYVCGNSSSFKENELYKGQKFRNHYEKSKFEAEKYVREHCQLPYIIFRPSIIIGDAYQGKAEGCTFGYYRYTFMFHFLKKQIITVLQKRTFAAFCLKILGTKYYQEKDLLKIPWLTVPYPKDGRVDMVTVDYVIQSMISIYEKNLHGVTVHLTHNNPPRHRFILHSVLHDIGLRSTKLIPIPPRIFSILAKTLYFLITPIRKYIKSVMWYVPYITEKCQFDRSNIEKYGNVSSASTAIALCEAVKTGRIKKGDIVLLDAFGSGLVWGACVIKW